MDRIKKPRTSFDDEFECHSRTKALSSVVPMEQCVSTPPGSRIQTLPGKFETPVSSVPGTSCRSGINPNERVNPFERQILQNLHLPLWSPSTFCEDSNMETPPQTTWAIDQMSRLFPTRIEESPSTHQNELEVTPGTEAKAQADIEKFFDQSQLLPSPVGTGPPATGIMMMISNPEKSPILSGHNFEASPDMGVDMKDTWALTMMSFPPTMPPSFEELLQPYMQVDDNENLSETTNAIMIRQSLRSQPCSSNTSLRRRLEFGSSAEETNATTESECPVFSPNTNSPVFNSFNFSVSSREDFRGQRSECPPPNKLPSPDITPIRKQFETRLNFVASSTPMKSLDYTEL